MQTTIQRIEECIAAVLGSYGSPDMKGLYGIDTAQYSWVESYLRDQMIRAEIERLRAEIPKIEALPIHRDELKARFMEALGQVNSLMVQRVRNHLVQVQARKESLIGPDTALGFRIVYPMNLTPEEIDEIVAALPEGTRQADIEKSVSEIRGQIRELERKIEDELSPQDRWFYTESGYPVRYPQGCRWTRFVNDWKKVVGRFEGRVDIEGYAVEGPEATAFIALGLDKIRKLTPLRKPRVKPNLGHNAKKLYEETVHIGPDNYKVFQ